MRRRRAARRIRTRAGWDGHRPRPLRAAGRHPCGDRVLVSLLRSCGRCERCEAGSPAQCAAAFAIDSAPRLTDEQGRPVRAGLRVGGFAESVVVDVSQAVKIPAQVADEAACLISCGVMTGFGAAINTDVRVGDAVAVIGCGVVGLNCVHGGRSPARCRSWRRDRGQVGTGPGVRGDRHDRRRRRGCCRAGACAYTGADSTWR